jgi:hypothetical protein
MNRLLRWSMAASSAALLVFTGAPLFAKSIPMLSTGVGIETRVPHKDFPLLVVFSTAKGSLLADVKVDVKNHANKIVVDTVSNGPWLYLGLKPGTYEVTATRRNGRTETVNVDIPAATQGSSNGQKVLHMTW